MKSSIKVELGPGNQPVIRMRVCPSDDVRDILFQQFKEAFGHTSTTCSVHFDSGFASSDGLTCIMEISPIPPLPVTNNPTVKRYKRINESIFYVEFTDAKFTEFDIITPNKMYGPQFKCLKSNFLGNNTISCNISLVEPVTEDNSFYDWFEKGREWECVSTSIGEFSDRLKQ